MTLTHDTDHEDEAGDLLLEQFKDKSNIVAFLNAFITQIQSIEDAMWQLFTERTLDTAIGTQLDNIGIIIGHEREGLEDEAYRNRLRVQLLVNKSSGTVEQVIGVFTQLFGDDVFVHVVQYADAEIEVRIGGPVSFVDGEQAAAILQEAKAAGVRALFVWHSTVNPFRFDVAGAGFDEGVFSWAED